MATTTTATDDDITLDETFDVLQNSRRRHVLWHLKEDANGEPVTLGRLARIVAAEENDCEPAQVSSQERKRVYVALYQCHMEKMADRGAIEYEERAGEIAPGPNFDHFYDYIADDDEPDPGMVRTMLGRIVFRD